MVKMIADYFKLSVRSLRRRKVRSWLTMLGIFIGIAAVVSLVSLSQGMQEAINEQFQKIGANRIIIGAGGGSYGPFAGGISTGKLTDKDLSLVRKVEGVEFATGVLSKTARVEFDDKVSFVSIFGVDTDSETRKYVEGISFFEVGKGRQFRQGERNSAIVGYTASEDFFPKKVEVNDNLKIEGELFDVVGIQKKAGTGVHDSIIRIPLSTAREMFSEPEELSTIFVYVAPGFEPASVGDTIKEEMRQDRDLDEGEEDFTVQTSEEVIGTFKTILALLQAFLIGIAMISLVVGGIGIMNTMYMSVIERTREIGIMKSVGARNKDVLLIFLLESGLLGLAGGAVGTAIGMAISKGVEVAAASTGIDLLKITFNPAIIIGALAFSFFVGAISGTLPALQAARLKPVDALRKK